MTWLLDFIHARKWLVELLVLAAIAGAVWWGCARLIDVGVQKERALWVAKLDQAKLAAARAEGRAQAADKAAEGERDALKDYVASNPLHGSLASLCRPKGGLPGATAANPGHADPGATGSNVLPLPSGSFDGHSGEPDQLNLLDLLAQRADLLSAQVREFQSR